MARFMAVTMAQALAEVKAGAERQRFPALAKSRFDISPGMSY
jgi:hypothetical protein